MKKAPVAEPDVGAEVDCARLLWVPKALAAKFAGRDAGLRQDLEGIGALTLAECATSYRPGKQSFGTFAFAKVRNKMLDFVRRERRLSAQEISWSQIVEDSQDGELLTLGDLIPDPGPGPEEVLLHREASRIADEEWSKLSTEDQRVLEMRFLDELTHQQMGDLLGCSGMWALKLVDQAFGRLRKAVEARL